MRVCIMFVLAMFCALAHLKASDEFSNFLEKGVNFYLRGDYDSAVELLKQVDGKSTSYPAARFYLGAVNAFKGKPKEAYACYADAISGGSPELKLEAARQISRLGAENGDWRVVYETLEPLVGGGKAVGPDIGDLLWYYSMSHWNLGEKKLAEEIAGRLLSAELDEANFSFDLFIDARKSGNDFAKSLDISGLKPKTLAGKSRMQILKGEKINLPQKELGLYSQIELAVQNGGFSREAMVESLSKNKDAPFAWKAAMLIAESDFKSKKYADAAEYALLAERMMPQDDKILFRAYMLRGDALRMERKYDEARYNYMRIAMNRKGIGEIGAESLYKTGLCWFEQGEWANAHAYFERVFVVYFKFEYWGSRAYYYAARSLYSLDNRRDACATLSEYLRRAKDRTSDIYKEAKEFYDKI